MRLYKVFAGIVLLALGACSGSQKIVEPAKPVVEPQPTRPVVEKPLWALGIYPEDMPESHHLMAVAEGKTKQEATQKAELLLHDKFLGPKGGRPFQVLPRSLAQLSEPQFTKTASLAEGHFAVAVAARRGYFTTALDQWLAELEKQVSGQLVDAAQPLSQLNKLLFRLRLARGRSYACARLTAVLKSPCQATPAEALQKEISGFASKLKIEPVIATGIPGYLNQPALRPAEVLVFYQGEGQAIAVQGAELIFEASTSLLAESRAQTEIDGRAGVKLKLPLLESSTVSVRLDAQKMLGDEHQLWSKLSKVTLKPRILTTKSRKIAFYLEENALGQSVPWATNSLRDSLKKADIALQDSLDPEVKQQLAEVIAQGKNWSQALQSLPDGHRARPDILIQGTIESHFASRMGARSVWHEATGKLSIYEGWSGRVLGEVRQTARAVAIGEEAASRKALTALAQLLGEELTRLLREEPALPKS